MIGWISLFNQQEKDSPSYGDCMEAVQLINFTLLVEHYVNYLLIT